MLFLLSPAKSLDYDTPVPEGLPHTTPQFVPQSTALIEVLREQSREGWAWCDEIVGRFDTPRAQLEGLFDAFAERSESSEAHGCAPTRRSAHPCVPNA